MLDHLTIRPPKINLLNSKKSMYARHKVKEKILNGNECRAIKILSFEIS